MVKLLNDSTTELEKKICFDFILWLLFNLIKMHQLFRSLNTLFISSAAILEFILLTGSCEYECIKM